VCLCLRHECKARYTGLTGLGWAGGLAGQGPSGPYRPAGRGVGITAKCGHLAALRYSLVSNDIFTFVHKMSASCFHAFPYSTASLSDGRVNNRLVQPLTFPTAFLQLVRISNLVFVHPLLHQFSHFVVYRIEIWTVAWPERRRDEVWRVTF